MVLSGDKDMKLKELQVDDGATLTMMTASARDYEKITCPEKVLKTANYPNGVAIDDTGHIYVTHYFGELQVYDTTYKLVRTTNNRDTGRQMTFSPSGDLLVAFSDGVRVFEAATLTEKRRLSGFSANGVAVHEDHVYCAAGEGTIRVFRLSDGTHIKTVRPPCSGQPQGLAVVDGRLLVVADRANNRILLLDIHSLDVHAQLPKTGAAKNANLSLPNDVVVDSAGNLLVMDTGNERIAVYGEDGTFLASVMQGFFKNHGNTFSYMFYNHLTGAIVVSSNDEHCITILPPIFDGC
eukprot:TRINITY_DN11650_c0_g1_i2.p1 TRINITY_DN11650_c0_g1~~TRINITY_DN11650_c0_g1_i2.p1  ORF type:complete len:294 (-),score=20.66 TRINITY_DN11650_c0_g1_i2:69-950(-)